jgi:Mn-dependent DtxR family transcriptional regulator
MTNEELDAKVLESVRSGLTRAGAVRACLKVSERDVDKSLQRLRRRGLIEYGAASRDVTFLGWRVK